MPASNPSSLAHPKLSAGTRDPISPELFEDAIMTGNTQKMAHQIAGGVSLKHRSKYYGDLTAMAVESGNLHALTLLLASGANPNGTNKDGYPALPLAANLGRIDLVEALFNHGAPLTPTPTYPFGLPAHEATASNHPAMLRWLFEHGAEVDMRDHNGRTPLMIATQTGNVECARVCLAFGADINAQDAPEGRTPAMFALRSGSEPMRVLCEHGFDISVRTHMGFTLSSMLAKASSEPGASTYRAWRLSLKERQTLSEELETEKPSAPVAGRNPRI